jgi:DNA recombination protein RmuC
MHFQTGNGVLEVDKNRIFVVINPFIFITMNPLYLILFLLALTLIAVVVLLIKISKNKPAYSNTGELDVKEKEIEFLNEKISEEKLSIDSLESENKTLEEKLKAIEISLVTEQTERRNTDKNIETEKEKSNQLIKEKKELEALLTLQKDTNAQLSANLKAQKVEMLGQEEKIINIQKQFTEKFENLANRIFDEKSKKFSDLNKDKLDVLLSPLEKNIEEFKKLVRESYNEEDKKRHSLGVEVEKLMKLNLQIGQDAKDLTEALKGSTKQQGDWGEMVLETILQQSGLVEGKQYFKQATLRDDSGEVIKNAEGKIMRPDIIVEYPDKRKVIIDSKVSLTSYIEFTAAVDQQDQKRALKKLMLSIRKHIDELSDKKYPEYGSELDFVMMFIPVEGAYIAALQTDHNLWADAYKKNVLLIGPTNIIAALRIIADMWERDKQSKNAEEIASRGGLLLEKFIGFATSLNDVGAHIEKTQESYNKAVSQLSKGRGNLVNQAESLKKLGIKYNRSKQIPSRFISDDEDAKQLPESNE